MLNWADAHIYNWGKSIEQNELSEINDSFVMCMEPSVCVSVCECDYAWVQYAVCCGKFRLIEKMPADFPRWLTKGKKITKFDELVC